MKTYLEYKDEKSAKFWQIEVVGKNHTVTYGKLGTKGQSKTKSFPSADEASQDAEKQIKAKLKKGYATVEAKSKETKGDSQPAGKKEAAAKAPAKKKKSPAASSSHAPNPQFLTPEVAQQRFDLKQYDPLGIVGYDAHVLFEGDVVIADDLVEGTIENLFYGPEHEASRAALFIIEGNLAVQGEIEISEGYPCFLVLGNLNCAVLHSFDNVMHVTGDAHIEYAFNGNYNHGSITIAGTTHVPYILNSDHDSRLQPAEGCVIINYYGDYDDFFTYDYYSEDLAEVMNKKVLDDEQEFSFERFIQQVKAGKSPIKKGVKPGRVRIKEEIAKLSQKSKGAEIKELDLSDKKLLSLPAELFDIQSLEVLNLEKNSFTVLPKEIGNLKNLRILNLKSTGVEALSASLGRLTQLEELNLSYCRNLKSLPPAIGDLSNLKKLTLWMFQGTVPEDMAKLTTLEELDIYGMFQQHDQGPAPFPHWVFQLTGLKKLLANNNSFESLPNDILKLQRLEVLELNSALCFVKNLPDLSQLKNLKELHCDGRVSLNTRPPVSHEMLKNFYKITTLEVLHIEAFGEEDKYMPLGHVEANRKKLEDDPEKLAQFEARLRKNSSGNYFYQRRRPMQIEDFQGIENLTKLKELDISWNKLKTLPPEILELPNLCRINVHGNDFKDSDLNALKKKNPQIEIEL